MKSRRSVTLTLLVVLGLAASGGSRGLANFRGAAGTLWRAVRMLKEWAKGNS